MLLRVKVVFKTIILVHDTFAFDNPKFFSIRVCMDALDYVFWNKLVP